MGFAMSLSTRFSSLTDFGVETDEDEEEVIPHGKGSPEDPAETRGSG